MATQWVLDKVSDALAPTVSNAVASAGSYAGGAVSAIGNGINGVGDGIGRSIKRYGDGVLDYGNGIMDWTSASGSRAQTASNPLGLSGGKSQGKTSVTSPRVYSAPPKSNASKTLMTTSKTVPQKKIQDGTPKKALPAPPTKPAAAPVKKGNSNGNGNGASTTAPVKKTTLSTPNPGAMRKAGTTPAKSSTASKPAGTAKKVAPVKPGTASAPKTSPRAKVAGTPTAAANPLGLSF